MYRAGEQIDALQFDWHNPIDWPQRCSVCDASHENCMNKKFNYASLAQQIGFGPTILHSFSQAHERGA
jgi:hypothetical protein